MKSLILKYPSDYPERRKWKARAALIHAPLVISIHVHSWFSTYWCLVWLLKLSVSELTSREKNYKSFFLYYRVERTKPKFCLYDFCKSVSSSSSEVGMTSFYRKGKKFDHISPTKNGWFTGHWAIWLMSFCQPWMTFFANEISTP